jgi:cellobiose phosphorylase
VSPGSGGGTAGAAMGTRENSQGLITLALSTVPKSAKSELC